VVSVITTSSNIFPYLIERGLVVFQVLDNLDTHLQWAASKDCRPVHRSLDASHHRDHLRAPLSHALSKSGMLQTGCKTLYLDQSRTRLARMELSVHAKLDAFGDLEKMLCVD
jgi:hypothetical protein